MKKYYEAQFSINPIFKDKIKNKSIKRKDKKIKGVNLG
jgi:hypothetical protein